MEATKRPAGRLKASLQTGPLVLDEDQRRVKIEAEVEESTADKLREYPRWVELSSAVTMADAFSRKEQYALREVFRRDRLWQERRKTGKQPDAAAGKTTPQSLPTSSPSLPPAPAARRVLTPAHRPTTAAPDWRAPAGRQEGRHDHPVP
jgi:hypothetical protein